MKTIVFPYTQEAHSESLAVMKGKAHTIKKIRGVVCSIRREVGGEGGRGRAGPSEEKPSVSNLPRQLENLL